MTLSGHQRSFDAPLVLILGALAASLLIRTILNALQCAGPMG